MPIYTPDFCQGCAILEIGRFKLQVARILIVDDNLLCRSLLREIISGAGHEVVGEAVDGFEAPQLVRALRPELVTLDLVMPGRNGLTVLQHLLTIDPWLPVVVCSASLDSVRVISAIRIGAKGFIVKPFTPNSVLDAVRSALRDAGVHEAALPLSNGLRAFAR